MLLFAKFASFHIRFSLIIVAISVHFLLLSAIGLTVIYIVYSLSTCFHSLLPRCGVVRRGQFSILYSSHRVIVIVQPSFPANLTCAIILFIDSGILRSGSLSLLFLLHSTFYVLFVRAVRCSVSLFCSIVSSVIIRCRLLFPRREARVKAGKVRSDKISEKIRPKHSTDKYSIRHKHKTVVEMAAIRKNITKRIGEGNTRDVASRIKKLILGANK